MFDDVTNRATTQDFGFRTTFVVDERGGLLMLRQLFIAKPDPLDELWRDICNATISQELQNE